jgi:hypothetical protein
MIVLSPGRQETDMEHPRLGIVLMLISMLIAMANLATDIVRLMLELSTLSATAEPIPIQTRPGRQEPPRQAPDIRQPDTSPAETLGVLGARGPPRRPRAVRAPFSTLPADFSINHAPWCLACSQPMRRNVERKRFYER